MLCDEINVPVSEVHAFGKSTFLSTLCTPGVLIAIVNKQYCKWSHPIVKLLTLRQQQLLRFNLKYSTNERGYNKPLVPVTNNDAQQHHIALSTLAGVDFAFLPGGLVAIVSGMMQMNTQLRSTSSDVVSNTYFVSGTQAVLNMIESMHTR